MKLENTGQDAVDLDFEVTAAGKSVLVVEEGIRKNYNENSGKTTLKIPFTIDSVIDGPDGNQGLKLVHFVPIETKFGEKQLAGILTITDLVDDFAQKLGNEVDVTEDKFLDRLKLKLVGEFITATHTLRADQNGKERANITRFEKIGKSKGAAPPVPPTVSPVPAAAVEDADW